MLGSPKICSSHLRIFKDDFWDTRSLNLTCLCPACSGAPNYYATRSSSLPCRSWAWCVRTLQTDWEHLELGPGTAHRVTIWLQLITPAKRVQARSEVAMKSEHLVNPL